MHAEGGESTAVDALLRFDSKAAALVLEEEVREAFFGSISTAIGQPDPLVPAPFCPAALQTPTTVMLFDSACKLHLK